MIISASRRTDIPAFYTEWLRHRIQAGYCRVVNPFNRSQVRRISLAPSEVDAIVFWTRHAQPLLALLPLLDRRGYPYYFQYTITGYGPPLEPGCPPLDVALATFRSLAERLPLGAVIWRYDPILLGSAFPVADHLARFTTIARALAGRARRVVISPVAPYRKTRHRVGRLFDWGTDLSLTPSADPAWRELLGSLAEVARAHELAIETCAQPDDYDSLGVGHTKCVDDSLLTQLFGGEWPPARDRGQRPHCRCVPSVDIGAVDTCGFGCAYCYATRSAETGRRRLQNHDPHAELLE